MSAIGTKQTWRFALQMSAYDQTGHEFVSDGTTYYRAARKTAIPVVSHAVCSAAVICSSTRPLVSMPTAHSAIEAMKKLSAKVCST